MRRFSTYYAAALSGLAMCGLIGCQAQPGKASPNARKTESPKATRPEPTPQLNAASLFAYGHLQERQGAYDSAITQYRKALDVKPDFASARNRLGITLNKLGRHAEAATEFHKAIKANPNDAYLHNNLGFTLLLQGQFVEAERSLRQALALKDDFQRARMNLGLALAKLERFAEAETELRHACGDADALFNMGVLMTEAHRYVDATRYMEQALAINPRLDAARRQLTELARLTAQEPGSTIAIATTSTLLQSPTPATLVPENPSGFESESATIMRPTDGATPAIAAMPATTAKPSATPATSAGRTRPTTTEQRSASDTLELRATETHANPAGYRKGDSASHDGRMPEISRDRENDPGVVMAQLLLKLARQELDARPLDGQHDAREAELRVMMSQIYDALEADAIGIEDLLCKFEDQLFPGLRDSPCVD